MIWEILSRLETVSTPYLIGGTVAYVVAHVLAWVEFIR